MEKIITQVKNTGIILRDTFALLIGVNKEMLRQTCYSYSTNGLQAISFSQGLLTGVPNTFRVETYYGKLETTSVRIIYTMEMNPGDGVEGMTLSFWTDGVSHGNIQLTSAICSCTNGPKHMLAQGITKVNCPDSVNEMKIEIFVAKKIAPRFTVTDIPLPRLPETKFPEMSQFILNPTFSDVTIKCAGVEFPAHMIILSVHSPVFAAMFSSKNKETKEKMVEIQDAHPDVMLEMLRYCYSEQVANMDVVAVQLYKLADKYLIDNLKLVCANYLTEHVGIENAVDLYCFARQHGIERLTEIAKHVIIRSKSQLFRDHNEFQIFAESVPAEFALEIFQL